MALPNGAKRVDVFPDATASQDADLQELTYSWSQVGGPPVTLVGATTSTPRFALSPVAAATTLRFRLVVNDGIANSGADTVEVTALLPKPRMIPDERRVYLPLVRK